MTKRTYHAEWIEAAADVLSRLSLGSEPRPQQFQIDEAMKELRAAATFLRAEQQAVYLLCEMDDLDR